MVEYYEPPMRARRQSVKGKSIIEVNRGNEKSSNMKKVWKDFEERIDMAVFLEKTAYEQELRVEILRALKKLEERIEKLEKQN